MKRIITCSDGTWNKPEGLYKGKFVRTNVQKIFESICNEDEHGIKQIKYYDQGVGAEGSWYSKIIDGATGRGLDENILDAYKFIIWNYEPGDEIYLFGFSRGAYTARSLAGLIRNCGLIKNNDLRLIKKAYGIYRNRTNLSVHPDGDVAKAFREKYSQPGEVRIKFIGVWDTVGALGIPSRWFQWYNRSKYEFHDTTLSSSVDYAYQALALDERRENFKPALWEKSEKVKGHQVKQTMEQVWFSGVHSNIGGGYPDERLSDLALRWMIDKAKATNLNFEYAYIKEQVKPSPKGKLYNSKTFPFSLLKDYIRKVNIAGEGNESISPSVFERTNLVAEYAPPNVPEYGLPNISVIRPEEIEWDNLLNTQQITIETMEFFKLLDDPVAGQELGVLFQAESSDRLSFKISIDNKVISNGRCINPPCHEMLRLPSDAGNKLLTIDAFSTSGNALRKSFVIESLYEPLY